MVTASGIHIHVEGRGAPVVLVHGWGMSASVWDGVAAALARDHRVLRVDLPGHGRSRAVPLKGLAELVDGLHACIPERASWVGWSLGGTVAMAYALRHPQAVERVIGVAATPRFVRAEDWPQAVDPAVLAGFAESLERDYRGTLTRFLALQFRGVKGAQSALRDLRARLFETPPAPDALRTGLALLRETDLRADLDRLQVPLRLIQGQLDALVPAAVVPAVVDNRPNVEAVLMPGAGHAPFLSHEAAFLAHLQAMLHG